MRKPCCDKQDTNKGAWSKQEDQKLIDYIRTHGEGCWRSLPKAAGLHRCGKSCRLRWINYLRPDLKRGSFGQDEEDLIIKLHALLGNRWSLIAGRLPGRTDNEVKNYWNSHIKRKLIQMGIDPKNHRLSQNLPRPQIQCTSAKLTSSSDSMINDASQQKPLKSYNDNNNDNDRVSDTASCLEDETISASPAAPLNLDLTISIPSPPLSPELAVENNPFINIDSTMTLRAREVESNSSPTLLLFS